MSRDRVIQLQERAEELGFSTITEAIDAGYHEVQDLGAGTFTLEKIDEQEEAHEAWLEERESICKRLNKLYDKLVYLDMGEEDLATINDTIEFIKKGEC